MHRDVIGVKCDNLRLRRSGAVLCTLECHHDSIIRERSCTRPEMPSHFCSGVMMVLIWPQVTMIISKNIMKDDSYILNIVLFQCSHKIIDVYKCLPSAKIDTDRKVRTRF